ncbi:hypothetical protein KC19_11G131400 [Ceratodon purpureus]|uniref:Uncharacterized protein n=1 Tax=Ceratodon purpureus TaxID=3225 RepID=A0A8T0GK33_CERPU|nr:hypothetical protein KC19_11G131400 [Ceratodon purpureus]
MLRRWSTMFTKCAGKMGKKKSMSTLLVVSQLAFLVKFSAGHSSLAISSDGVAAVSASDESSSPDLHAKGLILVKVYCLIIVFWSTFFAGVSPYFFRWNSSFLALGTQYAGGVFLGTAFIHFLSDSHDEFQKLTTRHYAFAELLAISGYLITMLGDLIIQWISLRASVPTSTSASAPDRETATKLAEEKGKVAGCCCKCKPVEMEGVCKCAGEKVPADLNEATAALVYRTSFGDALILILALCFHSVFEGIAIGVAETKQDAWKALWTISLHKLFAAIAMGVALLRMLPNRPLLSCFSYAFVFAISTPVGVAIGIIIDANAQGAIADWVYAVSVGLASGVFVYVAINHLLAKGYSPSKTALDGPVQKATAVILGAATIAVVMIWDT